MFLCGNEIGSVNHGSLVGCRHKIKERGMRDEMAARFEDVDCLLGA